MWELADFLCAKIHHITLHFLHYVVIHSECEKQEETSFKLNIMILDKLFKFMKMSSSCLFQRLSVLCRPAEDPDWKMRKMGEEELNAELRTFAA